MSGALVRSDDPATGRADPLQADVRDSMLALVPQLRAFAISLCGNRDRADDVVQETLMHALANIHSFQPGTKLLRWLFTILRNVLRSQYRKRRWEVEDVDGSYEASLMSAPAQDGQIALADFRRALVQLPADQREALVLVGASGFSYEETAEICGVAIGTVKRAGRRSRPALRRQAATQCRYRFGDHIGLEGGRVDEGTVTSTSRPSPCGNELTKIVSSYLAFAARCTTYRTDPDRGVHRTITIAARCRGARMTSRTSTSTVTFRHPFNLKGVDRLLPAGEYLVTTDEELIEGISFPVYRRISTTIMVPGERSRSDVEVISIDPRDLKTAREKDAAS